ncbi:MAG: flagellin, partial [Negativicutes bacterium]|nr:flagellin [Negativicutes bacterium]
AEINQIANTTQFNNQNLIDGSLSGGVTFQIGANNGTNFQLVVSIGDMDAGALSVSTSDVSVGGQANAQSAITIVNSAISYVSQQRANIGAVQNRLEYAIENLSVSDVNTTAAESRIRDVDMASEMMNFTKYNILSQAATAMMSQANQQPQMVLQLLR